MKDLYIIPLVCKHEAGFIPDFNVDVESPLVLGKKYHAFHAERFGDKIYYSLLEFGSDLGFEVDLFEESKDTVPHYKQWQETLILN